MCHLRIHIHPPSIKMALTIRVKVKQGAIRNFYQYINIFIEKYRLYMVFQYCMDNVSEIRLCKPSIYMYCLKTHRSFQTKSKISYT